MKPMTLMSVILLMAACTPKTQPINVYTSDRSMNAAEARTFIYPTPKCVTSPTGNHCTHY